MTTPGGDSIPLLVRSNTSKKAEERGDADRGDVDEEMAARSSMRPSEFRYESGGKPLKVEMKRAASMRSRYQRGGGGGDDDDGGGDDDDDARGAFAIDERERRRRARRRRRAERECCAHREDDDGRPWTVCGVPVASLMLPAFVVYLVVFYVVFRHGFDAESEPLWQSTTNVAYFIVCTVLTIGYGDVRPSSTDGKIVTIAFILAACAIAAACAGYFAEYVLRHQSEMAMKLDRARRAEIDTQLRKLKTNVERSRSARAGGGAGGTSRKPAQHVIELIDPNGGSSDSSDGYSSFSGSEDDDDSCFACRDVVENVADEIKRVWKYLRNQRLILAALVLAGFATFGALVMNAIEDDWGYVNSAYWAVATLTGVGYGDYAPTDKTGRLFTCVPALVPIRPRSRGERRSLRTLPGVSLRPGSIAFKPRPRRLSTPSDAFQLHPDVASYGTTLRIFYAVAGVAFVAWALCEVFEVYASAAMRAKANERLNRVQLSPAVLKAMGGAKGYVSEFDFTKAMLLAMTRSTKEDFDSIAARYEELDANGDGSLSFRDIDGKEDGAHEDHGMTWGAGAPAPAAEATDWREKVVGEPGQPRARLAPSASRRER